MLKLVKKMIRQEERKKGIKVFLAVEKKESNLQLMMYHIISINLG